MGGLDRFLAQSLDSIIRENLGKQTVNKIEKRLYEKYGISLTQSMEQFQKLDMVLREHFGKGADGIEENFFRSLLPNMKKSNKGKKNIKIKPEPSITVKDPKLTEIMLEAFGDLDKKKIIASVIDESKTIFEILQELKIPQTSCYRKINSLIEKGLLITDGHIETNDGKKVNKYCTAFQKTQISIMKNTVIVSIDVDKKKMSENSILLAISDL